MRVLFIFIQTASVMTRLSRDIRQRSYGDRTTCISPTKLPTRSVTTCHMRIDS